MKHKPTPTDTLRPGELYHIFNRSNHKVPLFRDSTDRLIFLRKYWQLVAPFQHTLAYCLLGNHFHFIVRVRSLEEIVAALKKIKPWDLTRTQAEWLALDPAERTVNELLVHQYGRMFNGFSKCYSKRWNSPGNLLVRPFRRKQINAVDYLRTSIRYVHTNPEKHELTDDFANYPWSSYLLHLYGSEAETGLSTLQTFSAFGGRKSFVDFHENPPGEN